MAKWYLQGLALTGRMLGEFFFCLVTPQRPDEPYPSVTLAADISTWQNRRPA